jgi:two-component system, NarL family, nitrate/nitrite response regulator NarL
MRCTVSGGQAVQVFVVGEDPLARSALTAAIAQAGLVDIVGQASPQDDVRAQAESAGARVLLWDLGIDVRRGLERMRDLAITSIPAVVLVQDDAFAREAISSGANGVVPRGVDAERLVPALDAAARGFVVIEDQIATRLLRRTAGADARHEESLTPRELEVLELLSQGMSNKLIADRLKISEHTAKFHVTAIMTKLGAETRTEAVVVAARLGLLIL